MLYLVLQMGLGPADAVIYQSMIGNTASIVKTAVTNNFLIHRETPDQRHRRNARALYSVVH